MARDACFRDAQSTCKMKDYVKLAGFICWGHPETNRGYVHVISFDRGDHGFEHQECCCTIDLHLRHSLHELGHRQFQADLVLFLRHETVLREQQCLSVGQHDNFQTVLFFEMVFELLQRGLGSEFDLHAIPEAKLELLVTLEPHRVLRGGHGFRSGDMGNSQIGVRVAVGFYWHFLYELVHFQAHQSSHERCRCGDGRDDFPCDLLRLVLRGGLDLIVRSSQVGTCGDEVDVEVRRVIFFKVERGEPIAREARRFRQ
mmetsp:Transcript_16235/g.30676  ORF Transcript_16235/g.30676 Transcript_16235/m.30676 type:complete len:257 (-) Transcript_16235:1411-2181(-)